MGEIPLRIEILKLLDTVDFKYAFQRARQVVIDGLRINVDLLRFNFIEAKQP